MWMQNSHSDVQQSSYMCINNQKKNHITFQSSKRFSAVVSEFSHFGNTVTIRMSLIFLYASGNQQLPAINGEQFPKVSGWTELKPVLRLPWQQEWVLEAECTDFVLQSHIKLSSSRGESRPLDGHCPHFLLRASRDFYSIITRKKKIKAQAKIQ